MESKMAVFTYEQQAFVRSILLARIPTTRAGLRGVVRVHFDRHALMQESFVSDHGVQLGKTPLGEDCVGFALFLASPSALASLRVLSNVSQVFQSD